MRRIERLINLIAALLETQRPLTAEEIRERIQGYGEAASKEAFRRAFERDKQDLRAAGIPIELKVLDAITEAEGYYIPKDRYYIPQLDLEPDELAALRLAAASLVGDDDFALSGALKLSIDAAGDPIPRPPFVWGAEVASESAALSSLYAALVDKRPVSFDYEGASGEGPRRLQTYAITHRRGHWYVVGHDIDRDAIRSFRVSRIAGRVIAEQGNYDVPSNFDIDSHLVPDAFAVGAEELEATLRFDPTIRWWATQNLTRYPLRELTDGSLEVEVPLGNVDALVSFVVGFAGGIEITKPASARRALVEHLQPFAGDDS